MNKINTNTYHIPFLTTAKDIDRLTNEIINIFKKLSSLYTKGTNLAFIGLYLIFIQGLILHTLKLKTATHHPSYSWTFKRVIYLNHNTKETNDSRKFNKAKVDRNNDEDHDEGMKSNYVNYENIFYETLPSGNYPKKCQPLRKWQKEFYPTCNSLHEIEMKKGFIRITLAQLGKGGARDVWINHEQNQTNSMGQKLVMKTMRFERTADALKYSSQQIDAMAMERLTSSPFFLNIYSFCGLSTINEIAKEGDIVKKISRKSTSSLEKLRYANDIAHAIADLQSFDGNATLIHRDLGPANVMLSDGQAKIIDFNAAYITKWDHDSKVPCVFSEGICGSDGRRADTRSPEECQGKGIDERIDIYGMGTLFFYLLTKTRVYHCDLEGKNNTNDWYRQRVISGVPPQLPNDIEYSKDKATKAIKKAMRYALTFDSKKRPSAEKISEYLERKLKEIEANSKKREKKDS